MEVKFYHDPAEKSKLKQSANDRGLSTIHDDFRDEGNHHTTGEIGRLTFDIIPDPLPQPMGTDEVMEMIAQYFLEDHETKWYKFKRLFD